MELLHQLVPNAKIVGVLLNPKNANVELETNDSQTAARALGVELVLLRATDEPGIDKAFASLVEQRAAALLVSGDVLFTTRREQIVDLALRYAVPTSVPNREQVLAGGLVSYGANRTDTFRQTGNYVGGVFKGGKPSRLHVHVPAKIWFL